MEPDLPSAPPVVAVVVVHDPGDWFDDTLDAFARQDYPNLRVLFLVVADRSDDADGIVATIDARIQQRLPGSFVRAVGANVGFGAAANEVLRLVEGDNGFFLICHDDVAPEPDALRIMVEELYRSNAGAVGPKIVEWDEPNVLQTVGLGMDRFGEIDPVVEPGEVDQEQHDGVRDVFVLPSAYLLVRADLFRQLGGFDPAIDFYGEDTELCWRIHHSGARVIVVPSARVRHVGQLRQRRPDLRHGLLRARHRMRSVATLTGASRLPARSVEMVLLTLTELVVGLFTGRFGQAWNSLRALGGLVPRTPSLIARRREVKPIRQVPEREVYSLQEGGSARLNSYLRSRETATYVGSGVQVRRWRQSPTGALVAWVAVLAGIVIGARSFFDGGLPPVGEFLAFPESPRVLLQTFLSGWNPNGAGATSPNPTGWATLSGLSVFTLFNMGMLQTLFVLGLLLVGSIGVWRLSAVFPSTRARIAALLVYSLSPLVSGAMSGGRLTVLVAYAATPWMLHLIRRSAGIETADPSSADLDVTDGVIDLDPFDRLRRTLTAALALGLAVAFAPVMLPLAVLLVVVFAAGTLLAHGSVATAGWSLATGLGAVAGAALLNFPWITSWTWEGVVGVPPVGEAGLGMLALASFEIGRTDFAALSLALFLPVIAAVLLARAWRLTWAIRSALMVLVFGALAVLADQGALPVGAPEAGVLLVPVALGLAISAAAALAAFDLDVRGETFGWRQPLGLLSSVAVVVGLGARSRSARRRLVPGAHDATGAAARRVTARCIRRGRLQRVARGRSTVAARAGDRISRWCGLGDRRRRFARRTRPVDAPCEFGVRPRDHRTRRDGGHVHAAGGTTPGPVVDPIRDRARVRRCDVHGQRSTPTAGWSGAGSRGPARSRGVASRAPHDRGVREPSMDPEASPARRVGCHREQLRRGRSVGQSRPVGFDTAVHRRRPTGSDHRRRGGWCRPPRHPVR